MTCLVLTLACGVLPWTFLFVVVVVVTVLIAPFSIYIVSFSLKRKVVCQLSLSRLSWLSFSLSLFCPSSFTALPLHLSLRSTLNVHVYACVCVCVYHSTVCPHVKQTVFECAS